MILSSSLSAAFKPYVFILLIRLCMAACLCSCGWHESSGMIELVVVGFLYTLKANVFCSFRIVATRKLILFSVSFSIVNLILGVISLKDSKTSCMFVMVSLYTIKVSSTYWKYPTMLLCTRMSNVAAFSMCCRKLSEKMDEVGNPGKPSFLYKKWAHKLKGVLMYYNFGDFGCFISKLIIHRMFFT